MDERHGIKQHTAQFVQHILRLTRLAAVATIQRGVLTETHATFPIFRQSFVHLSEGRDLYAA